MGRTAADAPEESKGGVKAPEAAPLVNRVQDELRVAQAAPEAGARSLAARTEQAPSPADLGKQWDDAMKAGGNPSSALAQVDKGIVARVNETVAGAKDPASAFAKVAKDIDDSTGPYGGVKMERSSDGKQLRIDHFATVSDPATLARYEKLFQAKQPLPDGVMASEVGDRGQNGTPGFVQRVRSTEYDLKGKPNDAGDKPLQQGDGKTVAPSAEFPSLNSIAAAALNLKNRTGIDLAKELVADPKNPDQVYVKQNLAAAMEAMSKLPGSIKSGGIADQNVDTVNQWLKDNRFNITLASTGDPRTTYIAGKTEYELQKGAGTSQMVAADGQTYKTAKFDGQVHSVGGKQIAEVSGKDGARVFLIPNDSGLTGAAASDYAAKQLAALRSQGGQGKDTLVEVPEGFKKGRLALSSLEGMHSADGQIVMSQPQMDQEVKVSAQKILMRDAFAAAVTTRSLGPMEEIDTRPAGLQIKKGYIVALAPADLSSMVKATPLNPENWQKR